MKVNSTFLKEIEFKRVKVQVLDVLFKDGKKYRFYDVPQTVVTAFERAKSKGRFFTTKIKDNYMFEQLYEWTRSE